jgi:hypothetical protein
VASGLLPAFKPAGSDQSPAPVDALLKTYLEIYGLKTYYPSMMYSDYFSQNEGDYVYYSLQTPTSLHNLPKEKNNNSAKFILGEFVELMDWFLSELFNDKLGPGSHYLYDLFSKVKFDCFHSDADKERDILSANQLVEDDKRLLYLPGDYGDRKFCERSSFTRGCIRVSRK